MSLPTATDLFTLDYSFNGVPFVNVESKSGQNTDSLDFALYGVPFVGAIQGSTPPPTYNTAQFFMIF